MLNILKAILFGIVEGITEWLPISSTGHLILLDEFIKLDASAAFKEMFNVVIQLGAILAVCVLFFHKLNPFSSKKTEQQKKETWSLWFKVVVAVLPSVIIGLPLDNFLESHFHKFVPVAIVLIVYGILFIVVENFNSGDPIYLGPKAQPWYLFRGASQPRVPKCTNLNHFTYKAAVMIGIFQVLALIPGTSRSGATILGGILIGASRFVATEFSFFLGIPTMFGASFLKLFKFFYAGNHFTLNEFWVLMVGSIVSFIVSVIAIKFLLNFIKRNNFKPFGWYRIVLGIILLVYAVFHLF